MEMYRGKGKQLFQSGDLLRGGQICLSVALEMISTHEALE